MRVKSVAQADLGIGVFRPAPGCANLQATFMWWQQVAILFSSFNVVADGGSKLYL
jgi:hypothetical protein